ncbi:MAG TPA: CaiB/BaiF CoA-transferase family protein [Mycobacteriales bacterium]|nr:CaiB/BaiF CoA-transferase family protein [Mycobacteriales bacterium]
MTAPGALSGLRVADFSRVLAGPYATMILGDLGADVIKVESVDGGDDTRRWGPPYVGTESAYYLCANRNKRSIALDLAAAGGREVCARLVASCDVVVHNLRPSSARRLGLSYEQVRHLREDVVHCAISGYGTDSDRPGYDVVMQAVGGLMSVTGEPDGAPMKAGVALVDLFTGLFAVIGIQAALAERARSGQGQEVDMALYDVSVAMLANVGSSALATGGDANRMGNAHANIVPYQLFETADGAVIVAVGNDRQFAEFCATLGVPELAADPAYATNDARVRARAALLPLLEARARLFATEQLSGQLEERGVPVGPVRSVRQVLDAPETAARGLLWQVPHPTLGDLSMVASPLRLGRTPAAPFRHPPRHGEHSAEVLMELGYDEGAVRDLLRTGTAATSSSA